MFHGLSPESVVNSIRSIISHSSINSDQKKKFQGPYDFKSKTGSFEMRSEGFGSHKTGFVEPHRSQDRDVIATLV